MDMLRVIAMDLTNLIIFLLGVLSTFVLFRFGGLGDRNVYMQIVPDYVKVQQCADRLAEFKPVGNPVQDLDRLTGIVCEVSRDLCLDPLEGGQ